MGMTIDMVIKDCEQNIKHGELFIKTHQATMEIGEIKEYQYYVDRDKLIIEILRKYQKIEDIYYHQSGQALEDSLRSVIEDGER